LQYYTYTRSVLYTRCSAPLALKEERERKEKEKEKVVYETLLANKEIAPPSPTKTKIYWL